VRLRDDRWLLSPVDELTKTFVEELRRLGKPLALFFDVFEETSVFLDGWLRTLCRDGYGKLPGELTVVVAGRRALDLSRWSAYVGVGVLADMPLAPFTEAEVRQLLTQRGVTDKRVVEAILKESRLPLAVATLAEGRPTDPRDVGDVTGSLVERFLQWENDPARRDIVLAVALARRIDQDIVGVVTGEQDSVKLSEVFTWLRRQPFVTQSSAGWHYHDVVREPMVRLLRSLSPQRWDEIHDKLANALQAWSEHEDGGRESWPNHRRQELELECTYHRLCAHSSHGLAVTLGKAAAACGESAGLARKWAEMIIEAGRDTGQAAIGDLGGRLQSALSDSDEDRGIIAYLNQLLRHPQFSAADRSEALRLRGRQYRSTGNYDKAITEFTEALELDPQNGSAFAGRGETYRLMGRWNEALADLTRSIDLDPNDSWTVACRGLTFRGMGRYDDALADFTRAINLDPNDSWTIVYRGLTFRGMGRYDDALADFTRAIEIHPEYAWAFALRGETFQGMGRYDDALADLTRVIEIDPEYAWAFAIRGETFQGMGRREEAEADFGRARGLFRDMLERRRRTLGEDHPDTIAAASSLADLLSTLGDHEGARDLLRDVLERERRTLGEDHLHTLWSAERIAEEMNALGDHKGRWVMELEHRRRTLGEDHPDTLWAAHKLAGVLRELSDYEGALDLDRDVLERRRRTLGEDHPYTLWSADFLAVDLRGLGDHDGARDLLRDVLERRQRTLGEDHLDTSHSIQALAGAWGNSQDSRARELLSASESAAALLVPGLVAGEPVTDWDLHAVAAISIINGRLLGKYGSLRRVPNMTHIGHLPGPSNVDGYWKIDNTALRRTYLELWYGGRYIEVIDSLSSYVNEFPSDAEFRSYRGQILADLGFASLATQDLRGAVAELGPHGPTAAYAHSALGYALGTLGQEEASEEVFRISLEAAPENAWTLFRRALLRYAKGEFVEALHDFEASLRMARPQLNDLQRGKAKHAIANLGGPRGGLHG